MKNRILYTCLLALAFFRPDAAQATTIVVNTTANEPNNDGDCSLREAIAASNAAAARDACAGSSTTDQIKLPTGVFNLTGAGTFTISRGVTIVGLNGTVLDWNGTAGGFFLNGGVSLTVFKLTIREIDNGGGGAFGVQPGGNLHIFDSTIVNNFGFSAGGAIYNSGSTRIFRSVLDGNDGGPRGGAIANSSTGFVEIHDSAIVRNQATTGGGVLNNGVMTIVNTTISRNFATRRGGGLANTGTLTLRNCTVAFNDDKGTESDSGGGGLKNFSGTIAISNTIVAKNTTLTRAPDCEGTITSERFNLLGSPRECTLSGGGNDQVGTSVSPLDPKLDAALAAPAGTPTLAHNLLDGSPALDKGSTATSGTGICPRADQRSFRRGIDGDPVVGGRCDIGAIERARVVFVVGSTALATGESSMRTRLQSAGFTVALRDDDGAASSHADGASVVLISSSVASGLINTAFRTVNAGIVNMEPALLDDLGMTGPTDGTSYGITGGQTQLVIPAGATHPLAAGLSGTVTTTSSAQDFAWGFVTRGLTFCAALSGQTERCGIFGWGSGSTMGGGEWARAPRVGFFATPGAAGALTTSGWSLFHAAMNWAAGT